MKQRASNAIRGRPRPSASSIPEADANALNFVPDLFMVVGDVVNVFKPHSKGVWINVRRPTYFRAKAHLLRRGREGWVVEDEAERAKKAVICRPTDGGSRSQDGDRPPLGTWRLVASGTDCTLTDIEPVGCGPLGDTDLNCPFCEVNVSDDGDTVKMEAIIKRSPATEEALTVQLERFLATALQVSTRPRAILLLSMVLADAPVPPMRVVKKFMNWVTESSVKLEPVVRGVSIVLNPKGMTGYAMSSIVKMVLKALPSPWVTQVVATTEEAEQFAAKIGASELKVLAQRPSAPMGWPVEAAGATAAEAELADVPTASSRELAADPPVGFAGTDGQGYFGVADTGETQSTPAAPGTTGDPLPGEGTANGSGSRLIPISLVPTAPQPTGRPPGGCCLGSCELSGNSGAAAAGGIPIAAPQFNTAYDFPYDVGEDREDCANPAEVGGALPDRPQPVCGGGSFFGGLFSLCAK